MKTRIHFENEFRDVSTDETFKAWQYNSGNLNVWQLRLIRLLFCFFTADKRRHSLYAGFACWYVALCIAVLRYVGAF